MNLYVNNAKLVSFCFMRSFDDTNLARLQAAISRDQNESHLFNFDPKSIDWDFYFYNIHIPGVLKYGQKK